MTDRLVSRRTFHATSLAAGLAATLGLRRAEAGQHAARADADRAFGPGAPLGDRRVLPADNPWNQDVSRSPVNARSARILKRVAGKPLHPDFGTVYNGAAPNGIPYVVVPGTQPRVRVSFRYPDESDPGPYPIPPDAPVEGGPKGQGDRHVLILDRDNWTLYELFSARPEPGGGWSAGSGAVFDLKSNAARPAGWTSADAAGLPILPGLARYDEVVTQKVVRHALRFTLQKSRHAYVAPARHFASKATDPDLAPMGMRVRLKPSFDAGKFPPQARVILAALKTFGMLLADNGGDWFLSGAPDPRWDDEDLSTLKRVKVSDFEVVKMGEIVTR